MLSAPLLASLALVCPQGQSNARVVINEFQYDDVNAPDDHEFIELYNRSNQTVDISNWRVESENPSGPQLSFTVAANTMLAPGAFWVMGAATIANVNQVIGTVDILNNANESLTLRTPQGAIEDTLVYEANKGVWPNAPIEGPGIWGNHRAGDITQLFSSWSRIEDGFDTDNNGRDFINTSATPGATNNRASILPYFDNFELRQVNDPLPEWSGSFKPGRVIDPTMQSLYNPNPISRSPSGGNCAIFWDEVGGGNQNALLTGITDTVVYECLVYLDATPRPSGELEAWSFGLQGTTGSFYNLPDPTRTLGFTANGNTGVSWTCMMTASGTTLYLIDHNDGGTDYTVLGAPIPIQAGVNDGWQRLRLQVNAGLVEGRFGGTFSRPDGTHIAAPIAGHVGGVYIGYREFVVANAMSRPFTCDDLVIVTGQAALTYIGDGSPTTVGVPTIAGNSFPMRGWAGFGLQLGNLRPSSAGLLVISAALQNPPFPLSLLGAPPTSRLYVAPTVLVSLGANAMGTAAAAVPVPGSRSTLGRTVYFQYFNVDPGLTGFSLPLGNTRALGATIGD